MPYISNKRPKPKPPQNNVMTISKALKAVNDNMDWTVLFIALLLVMVQQGTVFPLSCVVSEILLESFLSYIFSYKSICIDLFLSRTPIEGNNISSMLGLSCSTCYLCISKV